MANVSVQEGRCLVISPWDVSALKGIEKAIQISNIGLTPTNDGKVIRLVFPELTEERRRYFGNRVNHKLFGFLFALRKLVLGNALVVLQLFKPVHSVAAHVSLRNFGFFAELFNLLEWRKTTLQTYPATWVSLWTETGVGQPSVCFPRPQVIARGLPHTALRGYICGADYFVAGAVAKRHYKSKFGFVGRLSRVCLYYLPYVRRAVPRFHRR